MELYKKLGLPTPKFKRHDYITNNEGQSFEISFFEWDFERDEYYYFPIPDTFAGKIYEGDAELTEPPKSLSMEIYELLTTGKEI